MLKELQKPDIIRFLEDLKPRFELKARLFSSIRSFFDSRGFIEVFTPLMTPAPAPEEYIEAVPAADSLFLRTSPELQMKCMLASGYDKIYQLGPCFRKDEHGRRHRQEFMMLEFYQAGIDSNALMELSAELISFCAEKIRTAQTINFSTYEVITVSDAFLKFGGITVADAIKQNVFEEILVTKIEPKLPTDKPVFLSEYPASMASLARLKKDDPQVAERWELYIRGIEIANAYCELTDAEEQKARFKASVEFRKAHGMADYPEAKNFFNALDHGLPFCSGCALGVERLLMTLTGASDISQTVYPDEYRNEQ